MQIVDSKKNISIQFSDIIKKQSFRLDDQIFVKVDDTSAFSFSTSEIVRFGLNSDSKFSVTALVEPVDIRLVITT